jgi:hypothetical protein
MKNEMITRDALISRWNENGWKELTATCPDGVSVIITPCGYGDIHSVKDCDYFLVDGDMPYMGGDNLDRVIDELNRHAEMLERSNEAKAQLQAFYDDHERNGWDEESYSEYSDWFKSWYGYRPRFDWAEHNKRLSKQRRYSDAELVAFINRADTVEKCQIALDFIMSRDYLSKQDKERYMDMLTELANEICPEEDEYYDDDRGSYSPSAPWNAPGMKISDFITGVSWR